MFLFDSGFANEISKAEGEIRRLMDRAGAELIMCEKWDERRLAYEINGRKRGTYVLSYFNCPPDKITPMERDIKLSENVLRAMIVRASDLNQDDMKRMLAEGAVRSDDRGPRDDGRDGGGRGGRDGRDGRDGRRPSRRFDSDEQSQPHRKREESSVAVADKEDGNDAKSD
jgi:small subunit ribosomal protein S6